MQSAKGDKHGNSPSSGTTMEYSVYTDSAMKSPTATPRATKIVDQETLNTLLEQNAKIIDRLDTITGQLNAILKAPSDKCKTLENLDFNVLAGAGSPLFTSSSPTQSAPSPFGAISATSENLDSTDETSVTNSEGSGSGSTAENKLVPTAVVPLLELVEVKTGEEGLSLLYEEQCKLFRLGENEWKERGVGSMKIYRDPNDGSVRMVMRRDQVHKVCCNQRLTADVKLSSMKTNVIKAWTWSNQDYSDGEPKNELFCVRFKTQEQAEAFKTAFEDGKKSSTNLTLAPSASSNTKETKPLSSLAGQLKRASAKLPSSSSAFGSNTTISFFGSTQKTDFKVGMPPTTCPPAASFLSCGNYRDSSKATVAVDSPMFSFGDMARTIIVPITHDGSKNVSRSSLFGRPKVRTRAKKLQQLLQSPKSTYVSFFSDNLIKPSKLSSAFSSFSFKLDDGQPQQAFGFRSATDGALSQIDSADTSRKSSSTDDNVDFVSETQTSEKDRKLAESLLLPTNFFAYKYSNKSCSGCRGCEPEDLQSSKVDDESSNRLPALIPMSTGASDDATNAADFVFGASSAWKKPRFSFGNIFTNTVQDSSPLQPSTLGAAEEKGGSDDEEVRNDDNDPYFEPVVPLPDIVDTRTGDEEEMIIFKERAKLFRYDEARKKWKERGIGDLKLLYRPAGTVYRLLLRREQVHKVVLNQRLTTTFTLEPLSSSKNSVCWFGSDSHVLEMLAARFKTEEVLSRFEKAIEDCVSKLYDAKNEKIQDLDHYVCDSPFECAATLQVLKDDIAGDHAGVAKISPCLYSGNDEINGFLEFSTDAAPSLYRAGITEESVAIREGDTATFPTPGEADSDSEMKLCDADPV